MEAASAIDIYTTALGWLIYDRLWAALSESGLAYLPFVAVLVRSWSQSWVYSGTEGAQASVRAIEVQLAAMFLVAAIAGAPVLDLRITELTYTTPCGGATGRGGSTGTTYDSTFALDGQTPRIPLWWRGVMAISAGITNVAVAAVPCRANLRQLDYRLENTRIEDPELRRQLQLFDRDCFRRARAQFADRHTTLPSDYSPDDIDWPGSRFFLETDGYYANSNPNLAWRASEEIPGFPYNAARDTEYPVPPESGLGKPTCAEWWLGETAGLRRRLVKQTDQSIGSQVQTAALNVVGRTQDVAEIEDDLIRRLYLRDVTVASPGTGDAIDGVAGFGASFLSGLGVGASAAVTRLKIEVLQQAAPIAQAFVLMGIYLLLPFLLVFSSYSIPAVLLASVAIFAIRFLTALWAIALYLDSSMIDSLGIRWWQGLVDDSGSGLIATFVTRLVYIGLPIVWLLVLGWAGYNVAAGAAIGSLTDSVGEAGSSAARAAGSLIGRRLGRIGGGRR